MLQALSDIKRAILLSEMPRGYFGSNFPQVFQSKYNKYQEYKKYLINSSEILPT